MANWLSLGLFVMPTLVGIALLSVARRFSPLTALRLTLVALTFAILCALGLTAYVEQDLPLRLTWLPGTGTMTLHLGATGLYAALFTMACALLVCLAALPVPSTPSMSGVLLITLSAANVAFLSGHFLGRYVALEIVGVCVAVAPLLVLHNAAGTRLARSVYLWLRVGDAGFLVAILILMSHVGTLDITPALERGLTLDVSHLNWAVAGFVLAVWVKVGAWPFHSWLHAGHSLPLDARLWLYATVMPNLGLYLLYRITPLLVVSQIQPWILGLSLGAALVASALAALQSDDDKRLIHIGAAQGALALCAASAGLKAVVWLFLPVMTLLRPLFLMAKQVNQRAPTPARQRWGGAAGLLAGGALTGFNALLLWWLAQTGSIPAVGRYILDIAVVLLGYCALWPGMRELLRGQRDLKGIVKLPDLKVFKDLVTEGVIAVLGLLTLLTALGLGPLLDTAAHIVHNHFPPLPKPFALVGHWGTKPAVWLALFAIILGEHVYRPYVHAPGRGDTSSSESERSIFTFAQTVRRWIEQSVLEGIITSLPRSILSSAKTLHRWVEQGVLEWLVTGLPRGILAGATTLHHLVEQQGLEGALHSVGRATLFVSRYLQRWHTGRLRANLAWVVGTLVLLVTALVLRGW